MARLPLATCLLALSLPAQVVGPWDGGMVLPTAQLARPAGRSLELAGRPVDLALAPDGARLYAKDNRGLVVVNVAEWRIVEELACGGGSMVGLAVTRDGTSVLLTTAGNDLVEAKFRDDGTLRVARRIKLPGPEEDSKSFPCGLAISADGEHAFVCLSVNNSLAEVDLASGRVLREIRVGVAPYTVVLSPDGATAYVSDWGGRQPRTGEETASSAGTETRVDERGVALAGGVSVVDLGAGKERAFVETGRGACGLALAPGGGRLYVANANDDTVSVVDTARAAVIDTITIRPDEALPFGSMPNGLALSADARTLLVSLAGNNCVAVVALGDRPRPRGFLPTGWYPGSLVLTDSRVLVANIKGVGSRTPRGTRKGFNSHGHRGTVQAVELPDDAALAAMTEQVKKDALVPQALRALERAARREDVGPRPVPARPGEPSPIEHCVYIIKENRTYDQVFGAIGRGNGDPELCIYGREVTPNHHALADRFVLLDNYYCNGVLSADGHSWATEGNVTPYLERSFGGFTRSYTFGDDPLTYSSSGFIWDHVLAAGLTFRNYGEFDDATLRPESSYAEVYADWRERTGRIRIEHSIGVANLRRYSHPAYPGWNMSIPDVMRAEIFLEELRDFENRKTFPNLVILYLPNDHTSGTGEGKPTPRALVADNDLALGRIVEGLTRSSFWPRMAIFVNEDDPQNGFDHVDGHRSLCLVISPWSQRGGAVVSDFYNQSSVVHTIERILGIVPQNQLYALAPVMSGCFADEPDLTPFACLPNRVPLGEPNPKKIGLGPGRRALAELSERLALERPDQCDEDTLNRILWHDARGADAPYPAWLAGAHGKGLKVLGLRLGPERDD